MHIQLKVWSPCSRPADSQVNPSVRNYPTNSDYDDFAPNSVWVRSTKMGVDPFEVLTRLQSPGNGAKLICCVLGMTVNSSVVVQEMKVKLRPCRPMRFRTFRWGCVRWKAPCMKGCGWYVKLTWLAFLSLYYIICVRCLTVTVSPNQIIILIIM